MRALMLLMMLFLSLNLQAAPTNPADWTAQLRAARWPEASAQAVVQLNTPYWQQLAEAQPYALDTQLQHLGALGQYPEVVSRLARQPEVAGLLTSLREPQALSDLLHYSSSACYTHWLNLYSLYVDASDREQLTRTLKEHGQPICDLLERGFFGAEALFAFDSNTSGGREYMTWLKEVLNSYQADATLETYFAYVQAHGTHLRHRLEDEADFRARFRHKWWPALERIGKARPPEEFALLLDDADSWRFLELPQGEALLRKAGVSVIPLFIGSQALPRDAQDEAIHALLQDDETTLSLLQHFGNDPEFMRCFRRLPDLDSNTREKLLDTLLTVCGDKIGCIERENWLRYCNDKNYSAAALSNELADNNGVLGLVPVIGTPLSKYLQGREVNGSDLAWAGVDAVVTVVSVGVGSTAIKAAGRAAAEAGATQVSRQTVTQGIKQRLSPLLRGKLPTGNILQIKTLTNKELLAQTRTPLRHVSQGKQLDVTGLVRGLFEHSPLGRGSFKQLSRLFGANWEARIFMRSDRRVVVSPQKIPGSYLNYELWDNLVIHPVKEKFNQYISMWFFESNSNQ